MRVIFLNAWRAKREDELYAFITQQAPSVDVFCLQEANPPVREVLARLLPDFQVVAHDKVYSNRENFTQAIYVRTTLDVAGTRVMFDGEKGIGLILAAEIRLGATSFSVVNLHGISFLGDDKLDTPHRLTQSQTIIDAYRDADHPVLVGGDFNVLPQAHCIKMFAQAGYQDLIAEHRILTTRNRFAWEKHPHNPLYHSDFVFATPDVRVTAFSVPNLEVSDHLPLIVDFEYAQQAATSSARV